MNLRPTLLAALLFAMSGSTFAATDEPQSPVDVHVKKNGELIIIDVDFKVPVAPKQAWEVLTDFDHMSNFVSNVKFSAITKRDGDKIEVAQKGLADHGLISFAFDSVREIELKPFSKITSHILSGNMKKLDGTTVLTPDGNGTHVTYHAESISPTYVPPVIGPKFIEGESRHQFEEMRAEMLKRKATSEK
jgi:hypothetical protein